MSDPNNNESEFYIATRVRIQKKSLKVELEYYDSEHKAMVEEPGVLNPFHENFSTSASKGKSRSRSTDHHLPFKNYIRPSVPPRQSTSIPHFKNSIPDHIIFEQREAEYQRYREKLDEIKSKYESCFEEVPEFRFQGDLLMDKDAFLSESYKSAENKTIQRISQEMESTGKRLIQLYKNESNQVEEEMRAIRSELDLINGETKRVKDSSRDIRVVLSTQGPSLGETNTDTYQCFYDLKHTIKNYLARNNIDDDLLLKEIIQDMLTATRYKSVENDLQEIEALFKNSGRQKWINQLDLQVVECHLNHETSGERIDDCISKLNPAFKYGDLNLLDCVRKADRLSKYALAKDFYYNGEYSYEQADKIYGKEHDEITFTGKSKVKKPKETLQPIFKNPAENIILDDLSNDHLPAKAHNTSDVDVGTT